MNALMIFPSILRGCTDLVGGYIDSLEDPRATPTEEAVSIWRNSLIRSRSEGLLALSDICRSVIFDSVLIVSSCPEVVTAVIVPASPERDNRAYGLCRDWPKRTKP
jgi:hypothetical protein